MNTYLNQFLKICHPETHEIITNAEHAFANGEITREQKNDIIKSCIAAETERLMLQSG